MAATMKTMNLNHQLTVAVLGWLAISIVPAACYATDEPVSEPSAEDSESLPTGQGLTEDIESIDKYEEIIERPLFSETRRPPQQTEDPAPVEEPISRQSTAPSDFKLLGIVITPGMRGAIVKSARDEKAGIRSVGEDINGWRLAVIEPRQIRLTRGAEEQVVELERKAAPQRKPVRPRATRGATPTSVPAARPVTEPQDRADAAKRLSEARKNAAAARSRRQPAE